MTAKPQPMAGQSDASDDLIAELAKLMAQDAQGDKPASPASATFPVRIPGGDTAPPPVPRFNFSQSSAASEAPAAAPARAPEAAPVAPSVSAAPAAPAISTPVPSAPAPAAQAPAAQPAAAAPKPAPASDPFHFDFDLSVTPSAPAPAPRAEAAPAPVSAPSSPIRPPADPTFMPVDHDSIADLIAAELEGNPEPVVAAPAPQPQAQPQQQIQPQQASAPQPSRPAPQSTAAWSPVSVPASLDSQSQPARPAMRPLNLQPAAPRPEQDRFKVAPVFGLPSGRAEPSVAPVAAEPAPQAPESPIILPGNTPTRAEPSFGWSQPSPVNPPRPEASLGDDSIGRDPIDEIESLIGNAMRVELDRAAEPLAQPERAAPSPALRSLATPTVPPARNLSGADEAILAAAEATGVQIGWVDAPDTFEADEAAPVAPRRQRKARMPGMTRALAGPLVAVTLLLAAGFGLYWVLGLGRESGPAPLLTADTTPIKETPVVEPGADTPQQSVVFNEIDGVVPGAEEQLVSRDQADVNEVTQVPPTADVSEEGLANRKVRTVTVRPDGTIVSGDDSVAGSNILPVARPNVPDVPGAETASAELVAAATPSTGTPAASAPASTTTPATGTTPAAETPAPAATPEPAAAAVPPVTPGATVPAVDASGAPLAGKTTVIPLVRPAGLVGPSAAEVAASTPVNAFVDSGVATGNMLPPPPSNNALTGTTAASTPAPAPQAAAPATQTPAAIPGATEVEALGNTAPAYVQLASQRSEGEARTTAQAMVSRYGPLFGGANLEVQRVDLGERGIYYRVRVPAQSRDSANNICTNVKAAGGDCVVM